jgi:hypothetical protein
VNGQLHASAALPQGKSPWYPFDKRLSESQNRFGRGGEEKNSQPLQGLEPPIIHPVAQRYTNELSRLVCVCACARIFIAYYDSTYHHSPLL